jgi:DNA-binding NarL/FixJ family response regulator
MADVKSSVSSNLQKTAFTRARARSGVEDAACGCETSEGEVAARPMLKRQKRSRQHFALIDSHALSHECICDSLSQLPSCPVIASFCSIDDCVAAQGTDFSLIIIYVHGRQTSMLEELPRLHEAFDNASLFLITDLDHDTHPHLLNAAIEAGARGFVSTKTTGMSLVLSAIDFVQAGGFFAPLDPFIGAAPIASARDVSAAAPPHLTAREKVVMALLRQGKSNKIIARELALSGNTVKVHIRNILLKMSVTNRHDAISKAP